jgi:hypothetical protein
MGKWLLQAEATETETVTYEAGWDHADTTPGQILQISDENRVGARIAGRIMGKDLHALTADIPTDAFAKESTFTSVTTYVDTGVESDADAVFKCTIRIPSAIVPEGLIFEAGDSTSSGAYVGFNADGDLVFRAGDGASSPAATTSARLVIPYASLAKDQDLDILWDYRISPGRIRVWINNQYVAEQGTSAGADFLGSVWANTNGGGYGTLGGAATVAGETGSFTQDVQDSGVILKSTLQYWRDTDVFTPTQPHTIKESFSDGDAITSVTDTTAGGMDRNTNAVISCAIKTPAAGTTPVGIIVELGEGTSSSYEAFYLGFDGTGDLVVHAGAGGDSPDTAEAARIVVPASEWTADTWYHLTVQLLPATGEVGLWINHTFREWAQTSDLGPFQNGQWADATSGGYGLSGTTLSTYDLTGNFNSAFNGTLTSTLDYYRDVELTEAQNAFGAGTLTLDQDWVAEPGDSIVVVVADNAPDTVPLVPGTSGTSVTLQGRTRKDVLLNAIFFIQGAVGAQEWTVLNNREADTHQYQITALRYDRTKFDRVEKGIIIEPERTSLLPTGPVLPPTNLRFDESLYVANGTVFTRVNLSWSPAKDARVMLYQVEALSPSGNREQIALTAIPNITIQPAEEGVWSFWVSSTSDAVAATHIVSTAELLNQTVLGKSEAPGNVQNFTAVRGFVQVTLSWDHVDDLDRLGYTIKQGTDWNSGTTIVEDFAGNKYIVDIDTSGDTTFLIKAVDTSGNESGQATALTTSIQVLGTVTSLIAYQRLHNIRVAWTALTGVANVQYEIRHSDPTGTWETSRLLNRVATPYTEAPFSVAAETTFKIRIKPFVELSSGSRHYGPETVVEYTQSPIVNGYRVKSLALHPSWPAVSEFLQFYTADETYADGATIQANTAFQPGKSPPRMGHDEDGTWSINLTISSAGTPTGCVWEAGGVLNDALLFFDGITGDLVWRCGGAGRTTFVLDDMTSVISRWVLNQPSGLRLDSVGSNDLTPVGDVGRALAFVGYGANFDGDVDNYLQGTDISIGGKSWTLGVIADGSGTFPGTGTILEFGGGSTLKLEFTTSTNVRVTVEDSVGTQTMDMTVAGPETNVFCFTYDNGTGTLTGYVDDTLNNTLATTAPLQDTANNLYIGRGWDGYVNDVWWIERVVTAAEITELYEMNLSTGIGRVSVPYASLPLDTAIDIAHDVDLDAGIVRLWVDGALYQDRTFYGLPIGQAGAGKWRSAATGGVNPGSPYTLTLGEDAASTAALVNVTLNEDLKYYYNTSSVIQPMEVTVSDELTLTEEGQSAEYIFDFDFIGPRKGRMWVEYTAISTSTTELDIDDAGMLIDNATFPITSSFSEYDPQVTVYFQLDGAGDYLPFEEGTYEFTTCRFKIILVRDDNSLTKPLISDFTAYFHNDGDQVTMQGQTTDATPLTLTTDGEAASPTNIIGLTDDNTLKFEGTVSARKSDNTEPAKYFVSGTISRGTGAASVTMVTSNLIVEHETNDSWNVEMLADTTNGGLKLQVTGEAGKTVDWLTDIYVREFG